VARIACNWNLCRLQAENAIRWKEGREGLRDDRMSTGTMKMKMKMKMNEICRLDKGTNTRKVVFLMKGSNSRFWGWTEHVHRMAWHGIA